MNIRQRFAIEAKNKKRITELYPHINDASGIYVFIREADGIKYAYVGQAKKLLTRLASHLSGFQHIDLSIKKHGLFGEPNADNGWFIKIYHYLPEFLDQMEQTFIKEYANNGYQLRNKTAGGQGEGKVEIAETKPRKTYRDGLAQGHINARKEVAKMFEKYLEAQVVNRGNTVGSYQRAYNTLEKFKQFISIKGENENESN